jgi:hypothetical protein
MKLTRAGILTALNAHIAAVALLALVNLWIVVQLFLAWHTLSANGPEALARKQVALRAAQLEARPLAHLPQRVAASSEGAGRFYEARVPTADSAILAELGSLEQKAGVQLSRVQTAFAPAIPGVTEVRMDASVSGDYTSVMHFINSIERDRMFFVIDGLTLTGQQGGLVNLRLRMTTYLRGNQPIDSSGEPGSASGGE